MRSKYTDESGSSVADHILDIDQGGAAAGALPMPAGAANLARAQARRIARGKRAFEKIYSHISDSDVKTYLFEHFFNNGRAAWQHMEVICQRPINRLELRSLTAQWNGVTMRDDVGYSTDSVAKLVRFLQRLNSERPQAHRHGADEVGAKLLECIAESYRHFAERAWEEYNTPMRFVFPAAHPNAGQRDVAAIMLHYAPMWEKAILDGIIPKCAPQRRAVADRAASVNTVERALSSIEIDEDAVRPRPFEGVGCRGGACLDAACKAEHGSTARRSVSPSSTLPHLAQAGLDFPRGTCTTTDWTGCGEAELANAIQLASGDFAPDELTALEESVVQSGFNVEVACDADGATSAEMICLNCGGAGHAARNCPSVRRFRNFEYLITLLQNAKRRAESRAPPGGARHRRPPPRGMRTPFKRFPPRAAPRSGFTPRGPRQFTVNPAGPRAAAVRDQEASDDEGPEAVGAAVSVETQPKSEMQPPMSFSSAGYFTPDGGSTVIEKGAAVVGIAAPTPAEPESTEGKVKIDQSVDAAAPTDGRQSLTVTQSVSWRSPNTTAVWMALTVGIAVSIGAAISTAQGTLVDVAVSIVENVTSFMMAVVRMCYSALVVSQPLIVVLAVMLASLPLVRPMELTPCSPLSVEYARPARIIELRNHVPVSRDPEYGMIASRVKSSSNISLDATVDTGATVCCFPAYLIRFVPSTMVTDAEPDALLEVANGAQLPVTAIANVEVVVRGSAHTRNGTTTGTAKAVFPRCFFVDGVTSVLLSVKRARPGILFFFNELNPWRTADFMLVGGNVVCPFVPSAKFFMIRITLREPETSGAALLITERGSSARDASDIHCALGHKGARRLHAANISGIDTSLIPSGVDFCDCRGCRLGASHRRGYKNNKAPQQPDEKFPRYTAFGQRQDSDTCGPFAESWPHGLQYMLNFVDRYTKEGFVFFLLHCTSSEVASGLATHHHRIRLRLPEGVIVTWGADNGSEFRGKDTDAAAQEIVACRHYSVAHEPETNPYSECSSL